MAVGNKLNQLIKEKGLNANELAHQIGVTPSTIYSIINRDNKKVDISILSKISHVLDVSLEYFCDDYEDPITITLQFKEGDYTPEQLERIKLFAKFLKEQDSK